MRHHNFVKRAIYTCVCVHFALAVSAIAHLTDGWMYAGWWARPLVYWSGLNYSIWRFGFFTPDVGKSREVEITIKIGDEEAKRFSTLNGFDFFTSNQESLNRFYGLKVEMIRDDTFADLSTRSAVVHLLNHLRVDGPARTEYVLRSIHYPTMAGYAANEPVQTVDAYATTFEYP